MNVIAYNTQRDGIPFLKRRLTVGRAGQWCVPLIS